MALQDGSSVADATGPNASLEFGQAGQNQQMANSLKNDAPGAYRATQNPEPGQGPPSPPGGPPGQGSPPPTVGGAPDAQPQPFSAKDMEPGGRVFSEPKLQPNQHWKYDLQRLAHADHYPVLQALMGIANAQHEPPHGNQP